MNKALINAYLQNRATLGRSPQSLAAYRDRLISFHRFLASAYKPRPQLDTLNLDHVRAYHALLIKRGRAPSTQRAYLSAIKCFLAWCADFGHLPEDSAWIARIELPKRPRTLPPTPLSEEQIALLIEAAASPRDKALLTLMYACGLRRSEVVALNIANLDLIRRQLLIRGKGDKDRIVPVATAAIQSVQDYLKPRPAKPLPHSPLFATLHPIHPERLSSTYIATLFRRLSLPLGRPINPHLLRHTFAVHLLKGGADVRHVQALLGHESPDTTNQYLGLVKNDIKQVYDRAVAKLTRIDPKLNAA